MTDLSSLHQFLVLYTWFPLAILLAFLLLIARFYQKFSGEQTFYWGYMLVIALYGALFVRIASAGMLITDIIADVISLVAGGLLVSLVCLLAFRMLSQPQHDEEQSL
ncbi:MAG: hypothetical protein ACFE0Q_03115 [Anaerolineae bacterium]